MVITYSQRLKDRGDGLRNIICQNFVKDKQIFLVLFSLVFRFFVNVEKYIPTELTCKSVALERCFRFCCMIEFAWGGGGGGGAGGKTLMELSFVNYAL